MSFQMKSITQFTGLNSEIAPELIKDGDARDILNYRMEKVGKLVSRNGYTVGLFNYANDAISMGDDVYKINGGIIALGEFVLEEEWDVLKSDRLMVYIIRGHEIDDTIKNDAIYANSTTMLGEKRNVEYFLFSPITGDNKDILFAGWDLFGLENDRLQVMDARPQGSYENVVPLFAPNKELPDYEWSTENQAKTEDHWIKHYNTMNQYRNNLIISDRINGDMLLEDEYARRDADSSTPDKHQLHLRPNCLEEFDIDIVELDPRFQTGEENDVSEGVENGMALYNYVLPKAVTKATKDGADDKIGEPDWLGQDLGASELNTEKVKGYFGAKQIGTMLAVGSFKPGIEIDSSVSADHHARVRWNNEKYRRFTTTNDEEEYDDVLGVVELNEEKYIDNTRRQEDEEIVEGRLKKEYAADVYIWEEYKIKYYPTYGKVYYDTIDGTNYQSIYYPYYMRAIDRFFDKTTPGTPRIQKLKPKEGVGKYAPLGVWRYKFVWDFGQGTFSAPSTSIVAPDVMWSATADASLLTDVSDPSTYYGRFYQHNDITTVDFDTAGDIILPGHPEFGLNALPQAVAGSYFKHPSVSILKLYNDDMTFTPFGEVFYALKKRLYSDVDNKYGIGSNLSMVDISADELLAGNLAVNATVFIAEQDASLKGKAWGSVRLLVEDGAWSATSNRSVLTELGVTLTDETQLNFGWIQVPIFQTLGTKRAWLSVFDDEGRYRLKYTLDPNQHPRFALFAPWHNYIDPGPDSSYPYFFVPEREEGIARLGIFCYDDRTNSPEDDPSMNNYEDRPHSLLRGIPKQYSNDRLVRMNPDTPQEVVNRLIKTGQVELHILRAGEDTMYLVNADKQELIRIDDGDQKPLDKYDYGVQRNNNIYPSPDSNAAIRTKIYTDSFDANDKRWSFDINFNNIDIYIYGEGERYLGYEQLTSYFPSSLLFGAPRLGIKIPQDFVPKKAKRLLIFRTKASHQNDYNADDYGLVEKIDIKRDGDDNAIYDFDDGTQYKGIYYFDEMRDDQLDYNTRPAEYEGLRRAIRSRFNIVLNERVYYYNFEEGYRPESPRKYEDKVIHPNEHDYTKTYDVGAAELQRLTPSVAVIVGEATTADGGFTTNRRFKYAWAFADENDALSEAKYTEEITITPDQSSGLPMQVVITFLPDIYDATIKELRIYRKDLDDQIDTDYYYIGELDKGDEGIFVDNNKPAGAKMAGTDVVWETYEGGLRWSEPYQPDWIKAASFAEVKAGDGAQGTGIESQYGNLVIFKETSVHRYTVQAADPPISRVDEISPEVGCIAPNSLINVNNRLYFMAAKGFMSYNNNVIENADKNFNEELQYILSVKDYKELRDISSGYNPVFNELYVNVPKLTTGWREQSHGEREWYGFERPLLGHIYVLNQLIGYSTKFGYQTTIYDKDNIRFIKEAISPTQHIRLYFVNSLGQMRSGDIVPSRYGGLVSDVRPKEGKMWAGIYVETPYLTSVTPFPIDYYIRNEVDNQGVVTTTREALKYIDEDFVYDVIGEQNATGVWVDLFPYPIFAPVESVFKSKFFTGDDETLIKRLRKVRMNVFSKGNISTMGIVVPHDTYDERIVNIWHAQPLANQNSFAYPPSVNYFDPITQVATLGTDRNILSFIPVTITQPGSGHDRYLDWEGKPIRFSIEIYTKKRSQINELTYWWRGIHKYLM